MCALRIDKTYFPIDATFGLFFLKIKIFICASHRHRRLLHVAVFCMDNIAGCKKKKCVKSKWQFVLKNNVTKFQR